MSSVAQRLRRHLDEHGVAYRLLEHEPAGTAEEYHALLGTRYEQQAKSVFVRHKGGAGGGFAILAIQAQKRADLKRVATLLGARRARMGTIEELRETTGCEFGELPPLGGLFDLPLLLDGDLLAEREIYFNAASLTASIALDPRDLAALERPIRY
jgi:Ala-tRNA(Pro) deacylase